MSDLRLPDRECLFFLGILSVAENISYATISFIMYASNACFQSRTSSVIVFVGLISGKRSWETAARGNIYRLKCLVVRLTTSATRQESKYESNPLSEGFIVVTSDRQRTPLNASTDHTASTTCHTVTMTIQPNQSSIDGGLGSSFLDIDGDELSQRLASMDMNIDGSGESKFPFEYHRNEPSSIFSA